MTARRGGTAVAPPRDPTPPCPARTDLPKPREAPTLGCARGPRANRQGGQSCPHTHTLSAARLQCTAQSAGKWTADTSRGHGVGSSACKRTGWRRGLDISKSIVYERQLLLPLLPPRQVLVTLALSGSLAAPQLQASAPEAKDASTPVLLPPSPPPQTTPSAPSATPGEAGFQPAGAAATPRGLPDYDELRRRLFFIGDVPPPSPALLPPFEDAVKVAVVTAVGNGEVAAVAAPALVMLPPVGDESPVTGPATFPSKAIVGKMSNYADGDDLRSADLMLHDKGALAVLGELLTRPGARFRLRTQSQQPAPLADSPATRDQDIRAAMEADVFQVGRRRVASAQSRTPLRASDHSHI